MIIIARDVTDPAQAAKPFLIALGIVATPGGQKAIQMPDGTGGFTPCYAYQIPSDGGPSKYGAFGFTNLPDGAYQECKVEGQLLAYWTRKQDEICVYTWMTVPTR